eukprot:gene33463-51715_t
MAQRGAAASAVGRMVRAGALLPARAAQRPQHQSRTPAGGAARCAAPIRAMSALRTGPGLPT